MKKVKTNIKNNNFLINPILLVLGFGLVARLFLSGFGTLNLDQNTFIAWSTNLATNGFKSFYFGWSDYLPGYLYVLWLLGKISLTTHIIPQTLLYKLPAIISDSVTSYFIYLIVKKLKGEKSALISSSIYLFNPAVLANSTFWGQVDSLVALFSILAIFLLDSNIYLSAIFLSLGTLIKPQTALIAFLILILMFSKKWNIPKIITYVLLSFTIFILGFLPFWSRSQSFLTFVVSRLQATFDQYKYTSVNAFSFWGLKGFWKDDSFIFQLIGGLITAVSSLFLFLKYRKEKWSQYLFLTAIFLSGFLFMTRMHERHLLPVFTPLAIISAFNPFLLIPYFVLSLTYCLNLYYSYIWITNDFRTVFSDIAIKLFILLNISSFILLALDFRFPKRWKLSFTKLRAPPKFVKGVFNNKTAMIALTFILLFAFITRILYLWAPQKEYFDEVYHAFTARVMLHGDPKAWEWWNTSPEGFAYEWTHPPLAKEFMVYSMVLFGENSFVWRLPAAILGTASVGLIYLLSKKLFEDFDLAVFAGAAFALEGLPVVLSRIGMNDAYFLFFMLLSLYLFFTNKNFFSSLCLGFAAASKWTVFWFVPILGIYYLAFKRDFKKSYLYFLVIPFAVYLATYIPFFTTGHSWDQFIELQKQMWWYHTRLVATHAYSSPWWSWPFMIRPVWLYVSQGISGQIANIYVMGNPVVLWFGFMSAILGIFYAITNRDKRLGFIIFAYMAFFVPWAVSPRIMFLYHYLPSIPFLAIIIGYTLRRNQKFTIVFFTMALISFIYFYPHYSGIFIPKTLDDSYYWFSSWR